MNWNFRLRILKKFLELATFFQQKDETLKMLYRRLLKLKDDIQNITNLEAAHWYFRLLEGTPTLHVKFLQWVFAEFGNLYIVLDVYNIFEKLKMAHAVATLTLGS